MPKVHIARSHQYAADDAMTRIHALLAKVEHDLARYVHSVTWDATGRAASVRGTMFSGRFQVDDQHIVVDLDVSILAGLFANKIRVRIEEKLDEHFASLRAGTATE